MPDAIRAKTYLMLGLSVLESRCCRRWGWPPAVTAQRPNLDVRSWVLPNGLKVLFLAKHEAPVATVQIFYHVGSKDEHIGNRGVAHMFEHMMFKGSAHVPPEEHARLLKKWVGR